MKHAIEYRDVGDQVSHVDVLAAHGTTRVEEVSEGYEPAGSMARWVDNCFRVAWVNVADQNWTKSFKSLEEAYDFYDRTLARGIH